MKSELKSTEQIREQIKQARVTQLFVMSEKSTAWVRFQDDTQSYMIEFDTQEYKQLIEKHRLNTIQEDVFISKNGSPYDRVSNEVVSSIDESADSRIVLCSCISLGMSFDLVDTMAKVSDVKSISTLIDDLFKLQTK